MKITRTLQLIVAAAVTAAFLACGGGDTDDAIKRVLRSPNGSAVLSYEHYQTTPNGTGVHSKSGHDAETLAAIDGGLADAFRDARTSGYTAKLSPGDYKIYTPPYPCVPSPEQRIPSFLVHADVYDGTEFDQYNPKGKGVKDGQGVVYAAEMVLSLGTPGSNVSEGEMYVCPDLSTVRDGVRHGAEHIIIANNDNEYWERSWYHGNGFYHPLLPKREARPGVQPVTEFSIRSGIIATK